jgi:hypothetical protein
MAPINLGNMGYQDLLMFYDVLFSHIFPTGNPFEKSTVWGYGLFV